jgi:triphosphatase
VPTQASESPEVEIEWQFDALDLDRVERWMEHLARPEPPATRRIAGDDAAVAPWTGGALRAEPGEPRLLLDTYLDTEDRRLARFGFALRLRRHASEAELTLKDSAPAGAGPRRRLEVTEPLASADPFTLGTDGPVSGRVRALVGERRLRPVLEVRTRRRPYRIGLDGAAVAEVALDDTAVEEPSGGELLHLRRVEVEVEAGQVEALGAMVERLRADCDLRPATLSKFEAGLAASGAGPGAGPDVGPLSLPASPTVGELAFAVLRRNLCAMLAHEPGARLGEDPEEVHDMRVATRRLRAALALFAGALPARSGRLRGELGWLAGALGAVRDLDVALERARVWSGEAAEDDRGAVDELGRLLSRRRTDARAALLGALESDRYERLVASSAEMLRAGPSRRSPAATAPAEAVMPEVLRRRQRAVVKAARRARRSGAAGDLHRLRIRAKRLRYALEFVSELYPKRTATYVRHLVQLQDALGAAQDARVAAEHLHTLVVEEGPALSPLTAFVMGALAQRCRHEAADAAEKLPELLDPLGGRSWRQTIRPMERRRRALGRRAAGRRSAATGHGGAAPSRGGEASGARRPCPSRPPPTSGRQPQEKAEALLWTAGYEGRVNRPRREGHRPTNSR